MSKAFNVKQYINKSATQIENIDLSVFSTEELKKGLAASLEITAKHLVFLGHIWRELESRGENLDHLKTGLARYLPLIGSGKIDANVVIKFAGQQLLLKEIALLPNNQQQDLVQNEMVPLVTINRAGDYVDDVVNITNLHSKYYAQIFDDGSIRSIAQQKKFLEKRPRRVRQKKIRNKKVTVDRNTQSIKTSTTNILIEDILSALAQEYDKSVNEIMEFMGIKEED